MESIPSFYSGRSILLTGATGFFGKVLIEKLLRSCPDVILYVLVRPKKGKEIQERLLITFEDKLYDRVKKERPGVLEKNVIPIAGDTNQIGLGLSKEDRNFIINNVSVIFHAAASVRFDDSLKDAVVANLRSAREMSLLALEVKNLAVLVHVSTAFVNCDIYHVEEILYPPKADWRKTIDIVEKSDLHTMKILTEKYTDKLPNTYTFTKGLGEHCINDLCKGKIPVVIVRPSIVVSSLKEPVPGWADNFNGPVGILMAYGKGIMRTLYCDETKKPDYIPIDITIKGTIVAAWNTALKNDRSKIDIVHASSYKYYWIRVNHKQLAEDFYTVSKTLPLNTPIWTINGHTTKNRLNCYLRTILFQLFPAICLDELMKVAGKKPMLKVLQRRIYIAQVALRYFMNHEWDFENKNFLGLLKVIPEEDKQDWDFDFPHYDFVKFAHEGTLGGRRYLLKESDESIPDALKLQNRLLWLDRIIKLLFYGLLFWIVYKLELFDKIFQKSKGYLKITDF